MSGAQPPAVSLVKAGSLAGLRKLLSRGPGQCADRDANGLTALCHAAASGRADMAATLLAAGADPNSCDHLGVTALMRAAKLSDPTLALMLLDAGADIDAADEKGATAAFRAVKAGSVRTARALIERGADLDKLDKRGDTPLAAAYGRKACGMLDLLVDAGASHGPLLRRVQEAAANPWAQWRASGRMEPEAVRAALAGSLARSLGRSAAPPKDGPHGKRARL